MTSGAASGAAEQLATIHRLPDKPLQESPHAGREPLGEDWILPILRRNAVWFCQLRWIVAATLAIIGLVGLAPGLSGQLGLNLAPEWAMGAAACVALSNVAFWLLARAVGAAEAARGQVVRLLWAQIVIDLLVLTAVIYGLGGDLVSLRFMYLFHIILACIVFPARASLAVVALAALMHLASQVMVSLEILPRPPSLIAANAVHAVSESAVSLVYETGAMLLIWGVIWYLVSRLVRRLRRRDRQLALTNRRLEASLEERTLHMLQTTHQLKAPFAAIHAQTQLLLGGYCGELPARIRTVVQRVAGRAQALSRQIQSMLQLANLRSRGQTALPLEEYDLAKAVQTTLSRLEPSARQRRIRFRKRIRPITVHAVPDHVAMLLDNLIVNAVNYSYDEGVVSIICLRRGSDHAVVSVRDRGIGIPADKLPRVFDDYFRTDEAAAHNRDSTGLGLAIVRQVANEAGISIVLKSAPGWGTRFVATLPRRSAGNVI